MSNEKNKIEALLFASAKRMSIDDISNVTGIRDHDKIKAALDELKFDIEERGASMILHEENGFWKLTVKEHYMPMLRKVLVQAELDKPLMETLAVIAWKFPVLQADVIKIRHNKAYEHLKQLDELGFISRNRFGRTNKISLTQKFFEYFDLPTKEQAKEVFRAMVPEKVQEKVLKSEAEIDEAEEKIETMKAKQEEMKKDKKERDEAEKLKSENEEKESEKVEESKTEINQEVEENNNQEKKEDIENKEFSEPQKEDQNVSIEMPEVQEQDEVSESDDGSERKE